MVDRGGEQKPGNRNQQARRRWPRHGTAGAALVLICWPANWFLPGIRTAFFFFPLWLGYILVIDALVYARSGTSIWTRSRTSFVLLFCLSAPVWWLFELINLRTRNWEYLGRELFTTFQFNLLCTIAFSIVIPAMFETAELLGSFRWMDWFKSGLAVRATPSIFVGLLVIGVATLIATLTWPKIFYPFVWISLVLMLEPVNYWTGRPHFLQKLRNGDWRLVVSLALGGLVCGFFWEMWNYWSFPKWIYHTPGAGFWRIFEMPLLGYGGYIPFALELFAMKSFVWPKLNAVEG